MDIEETPRRPGRPRRAEVEAGERRRRKSGSAKKLDIPQSVKDAHPGMNFFWCVDDQGKVQRLTTEDDWDVVPDVAKIHAGPGSEGRPVKHVLLMKPERFVVEDRKAMLARLRDREADTRKHPNKSSAVESGADFYMAPD